MTAAGIAQGFGESATGSEVAGSAAAMLPEVVSPFGSGELKVKSRGDGGARKCRSANAMACNYTGMPV